MLSPCSNIFKRFISHCFAFKVMHVSYQNKQTDKPNISIYKFGLPVCLFVCLFVSNKRQNGWTDRAHFFCGTSRDPREGWSNFQKFASIKILFLKILKIHKIFFVFVLQFTHRDHVHNGNGRWARSGLIA